MAWICSAAALAECDVAWPMKDAQVSCSSALDWSVLLVIIPELSIYRLAKAADVWHAMPAQLRSKQATSKVRGGGYGAIQTDWMTFDFPS